MDGQETTIKITWIDPKAWVKPGSNQKYWTVHTEQSPSEPTKYIQDEDKGVAPPKLEAEYKGKQWGNKFYPSNPNAPSGGFKGASNPGRIKADQDKQSDIKAEWAIGKAMQSLGLTELDQIEEMAKKLYLMVDRVKGIEAPKAPAS